MPFSSYPPPRNVTVRLISVLSGCSSSRTLISMNSRETTRKQISGISLFPCFCVGSGIDFFFFFTFQTLKSTFKLQGSDFSPLEQWLKAYINPRCVRMHAHILGLTFLTPNGQRKPELLSMPQVHTHASTPSTVRFTNRISVSGRHYLAVSPLLYQGAPLQTQPSFLSPHHFCSHYSLFSTHFYRLKCLCLICLF